MDIKSTSQRTYAGFRASCDQYDYDRQAAFYLDGVGGKRFVFVGVQKVAPHGLFVFDTATEPQFINNGRRKYRALLREWQRRISNGRPFMPASWQASQPELVEKHA